MRNGKIAAGIERPALKKLIEEGEIEVVEAGRVHETGVGGSSDGIKPSRGRAGGGATMRNTGDR
jgi:hypothetical protein